MIKAPCPRIVILDDEPEEISPLTNSLKLSGVDYIHFTGRVADDAGFPKKPLASIRYLFLDIFLEGATVHGDLANALSTLSNALQRIVGSDNGPYIIVVWSDHVEYVEKVRARIREIESVTEPFEVCAVSKKIFQSKSEDNNDDTIIPSGEDLSEDHGNDALTAVFNAIDEQLELADPFGSFRLLMQLEDSVSSASSHFVKKYCDYSKDGASDGSLSLALCHRELWRTLHDSRANCEKINKDKDAEEILQVLGRGFAGELGSCISEYHAMNGETKLKLWHQDVTSNRNFPDFKAKANLNTALWVDLRSQRQPTSGAIWRIENDSLLDSLKVQLKDALKPLVRALCLAIVTPACDQAQAKKRLVTKDSGHLERVVFGIVLTDVEPEVVKQFPSGAAWFGFGPITFGEFQFDAQEPQGDEGNAVGEDESMQARRLPVHILFHFGTVQTMAIDNISKGHFECAMDNEVLFDLQAQASSHIGRLGNALILP